MSGHPDEDRLHELVEGALVAEDRVAIEAHVSGCATCRADVAAMRELVTRLAALPRELAPAHDLRGGMWQKIDGEYDAIEPDVMETFGAAERAGFVVETIRSHGSPLAGQRPPLGQRTLASARPLLAAAALLLVVLTSAITLLVQRRTAGQTVAGPVDDIPAGAVDDTSSGRVDDAPAGGIADASQGMTLVARHVSAVESRYRIATQELQQLLEEQRAQLSPATVQLIEENLLILDRALMEAREALAIQPGNVDLSRILVATWEKKLDLLRTATQRQAGI